MNKELSKEDIVTALKAILQDEQLEIDQTKIIGDKDYPPGEAVQTFARSTKSFQMTATYPVEQMVAHNITQDKIQLFLLDVAGMRGIVIGWLAAKRLAELEELERIRVMTPDAKLTPDCSS